MVVKRDLAENVRASLGMGKRKPAGDGSVPVFHATTAYKQWVRAELARREWSLAEFRDRMKRIGVSSTTAGLSQFLGREEAIPAPSNTTLMPAMNRVLGVAPPPVCDPSDQYAQLRDRLYERMKRLTPRERAMLEALLGDDSGDSRAIRD